MNGSEHSVNRATIPAPERSLESPNVHWRPIPGNAGKSRLLEELNLRILKQEGQKSSNKLKEKTCPGDKSRNGHVINVGDEKWSNSPWELRKKMEGSKGQGPAKSLRGTATPPRGAEPDQ